MRLPRIPESHRLPGGFVVEIVFSEVPKREPALTPDDLGWYDTLTVDRGRITLWEGLTPRQRWRKLWHEMIHAFADAQNYAEGLAGYGL